MNYGACGNTGRVMENRNKDNAVGECEYRGDIEGYLEICTECI